MKYSAPDLVHVIESRHEQHSLFIGEIDDTVAVWLVNSKEIVEELLLIERVVNIRVVNRFFTLTLEKGN